MISTIEKKTINKLLENKNIIFIILITILAIALRLSTYNFESKDYLDFLCYWYRDIEHAGGIHALNKQVGNYSIPYQFLISLFTYLPFKNLYDYKTLSVIFDFVLAIFGSLMVQCINNKIKFWVPYSLILFMPTIALNSGTWAQADSIYSAFIAISLYCLLKNKNAWAFIFLGFAFAFKLQTVFILPVYLLIYVIRKNFSIFYFVIPIISFYFCNLPGLIAGRSFLDPIRVYKDQSGTYHNINMGYPNFTSLLNLPVNGSSKSSLFNYNMVHNFLILLTLAILLIGYMYIISNWKELSNFQILELSVWTFWTCVMFLPGMHGRYAYMVDFLLLLMTILNKKFLPILAVSLINSTLAYTGFIFDVQFSYITMAIIIVLIYVVFTFMAFTDKPIFNKEITEKFK